MSLNGLFYADVPLRNNSLTHSLTVWLCWWLKHIGRAEATADAVHRSCWVLLEGAAGDSVAGEERSRGYWPTRCWWHQSTNAQPVSVPV